MNKLFYDYPCNDLVKCIDYYDLSIEDLDDFVKSHCACCPDSCLLDVPYDVGLPCLKQKLFAK